MAPMMVGALESYPAAARSKAPPKPPISASAPGRAVDLTADLMRETRSLPASIETPAEAYVRGSFRLVSDAASALALNALCAMSFR